MEINPRKTSGVRHLGRVDISGIREDILAIPEAAWAAEDAGKPNRFDAFDRTQHIVFRFVSSFDDCRGSYDRPAWAEWRGRIEPVIARAIAPYGYERVAFPRVMLARMAAGGIIRPHVDVNPAARWPHKVHVPILTNDRVAFLVGDKEHHFPEGEAVEVNNLGIHAVRNGGDTDRIHLIFECYDLDQPGAVAA